MATLKQIDSNRRNAQKSTGPRTVEGKAASKFNALKHGIDAKSQVVFDESAEGLNHLRSEYEEQYEPSNPTERLLVDTLVNIEWRLRRLRVAEAEVWEAESDTLLRRKKIHNPKAYVTGGETFVFGMKSFIHVQRVITACERAFHRALKELQRLKAESKPPAEPEQTEPTKATSNGSASISKIPESSENSVAPRLSVENIAPGEDESAPPFDLPPAA